LAALLALTWSNAGFALDYSVSRGNMLLMVPAALGYEF
jgi:hypothetical protein